MNPYQELFASLASEGIVSESDVVLLQDDLVRANEVSATVTDFFLKQSEVLIQAFLASSGNRLIFTDVDDAIRPVAKKAVLYSDTSAFISSFEVHKEINYDVADSDGYFLEESGYSSISSEGLRNLMILKPLLLQGLGLLVPRKICQTPYRPIEANYNRWVRNRDWMSQPLRHEVVALQPDRLLSGSRLDTKKETILKLSLNDQRLEAQLTETGGSQVGLGIKVYLPHLKGMELEDLLRLRADEDDSFARFQYALKEFFNHDPTGEDAKSFLAILKEVDYQIRVLRDRFNKLKRSAWAEAAGLSVATTGLLSLYLVPGEAAKFLSQLLGIASASQALKFISTHPWSPKGLADSDFYYAWRVGRISL